MKRPRDTIKTVDLLQTREPGARLLDAAQLRFRQSPWGLINGETHVEMWLIDEPVVHGGRVHDMLATSGTATRLELLSMAHAALVLAGEPELAAKIQIPNRPSFVGRQRARPEEPDASDQ